MPRNCVNYTFQYPYQIICHQYHLLLCHVPQLYAGFVGYFWAFIPQGDCHSTIYWFQQALQGAVGFICWGTWGYSCHQYPSTSKFPGVYLSPTGNIQGTLKVFDLKKSVVKKTRTMKEFHMPDRVINLVLKWANRSSR